MSKKLPQRWDSFSSQAALVRDLIQKGRVSDGLACLDEICQDPAMAAHHHQIASLVGDSELRLNRFESAAAAYDQAADTLSGNDERDWFRPALGQIRALLKASDFENAALAAQRCWDRAEALESAFKQQKNLRMADLASSGPVMVRQRPIRCSVIASRIAQAFLENGAPDTAKDFFKRAIRNNPRGGCRARQGLAQIALREGNYAKAERRAGEALLVGKYQAKTVSAWALLIEARQQQGKRSLKRGHAAAIFEITDEGVRSRTTLEVCKLLRSYGDNRWLDLAERWRNSTGQSDSKVRLQLDRLLLADLKLGAATPNQISQVCLQIAQNPSARPSDIRSSIRTYTETALTRGKPLDSILGLLRRVELRWGKRVAIKTIHSAAKGAAAVETDAARQLYARTLGLVTDRSSAWGKTIWSLGLLEEKAGNNAKAMARRAEYFENEAMPARFRLQAALSWINLAADAPEIPADDVDQLKATIDTLVAEVSDWQLLLDIGRDLSFQGSAFRSLRENVIQRATTTVDGILSETNSPSTFLNALLMLTRREFSDFRTADLVTVRWEQFSDQKKQWFWTDSNKHWEYLSLVIKSYVYERNYAGADQLANALLVDSAVPGSGKMHIGAAFAFSLIAQKRFTEALELYESLVQQRPTHRLAGQAYYWLTLRSEIEGDRYNQEAFLLSLRQCFGNKTNYRWEDQLLVRAEMALSEDFEVTERALEWSQFSEEELNTEYARYVRDRERLRNAL